LPVYVSRLQLLFLDLGQQMLECVVVPTLSGLMCAVGVNVTWEWGRSEPVPEAYGGSNCYRECFILKSLEMQHTHTK